jgi:ABC-type transport system involved in multi-copper enzyme maturation permease subunit
MSPIHDQTYRHYEGHREPPGKTWGVIAWAGIRNMITKRAFLGLLIFAWVPFLVRAVQFWVVANYPQVSQIIAPNAATFRDVVSQQGIFAFFVTIYVGAGLIASDRRANALQIYLSKPISRTEYIVGKLATLLFFLLGVTLLPALLLLLIQISFAANIDILRAHPFLPASIVLATIIQSLVMACTMLALSALSNSPRYVAILYTGAIFFTTAIFGFMTGITGSTRMAWVSITSNVSQVTDVIFRQPPSFQSPWQISLLVILGLLALSVSVLERRVKGVEVVK